MATALLASDLEMDSATSLPVAPAGKLRTEPSGNVRETDWDIQILLVQSRQRMRVVETEASSARDAAAA
jgi:hypothetical protein